MAISFEVRERSERKKQEPTGNGVTNGDRTGEPELDERTRLLGHEYNAT